MEKSTRITIETESLLVFQGRASNRSWCEQCAGEVETIALESTAVLSNLSPREFGDWINKLDLHRLRTPGGAELICLNSLLARLGSSQTR